MPETISIVRVTLVAHNVTDKSHYYRRSFLLCTWSVLHLAVACNPSRSGSGVKMQPPAVSRQESYELTRCECMPLDHFGSAASASSDRVLIGACRAVDDAGRAGAAYLFRYDSTRWVQEQRLTSIEGSSDDAFGSSVSVLGSIAVVGAPAANFASGRFHGSVYVFRLRGGIWTQEQRLTASNPNSRDLFGQGVAVGDEEIIVGAPYSRQGGAAYVFRHERSNWTEVQEILPDGSSARHFGSSVSIFGDTLLIGDVETSDFLPGVGSVYVFNRKANTWNQTHRITSSDGSRGDEFGHSVFLHKKMALIGAPNHSVNSARTGSGYLFLYDGTTWTEAHTFAAQDPCTSFGFSVSLSDDIALIGSPCKLLIDDRQTPGAAYMFRRDGTRWVAESKLTAADGNGADQFGSAVALVGGFAFVGARNHDCGQTQSYHGAAYVFNPR